MLNVKCKKPLSIYKHSIRRLLLHFRIAIKKRKSSVRLNPHARIIFISYSAQLQRKNMTQVSMGSGISKPFRGFYYVNFNQIFVRLRVQYMYMFLKFLKKFTSNFKHLYFFNFSPKLI